MSTNFAVPLDVLRIDAVSETERIVAGIRGIVFQQLKRRGAVIGVSGGIDSSVVAYLCARALGKDRVLALFTPETESSPDSRRLARIVAECIGAAVGCRRHQPDSDRGPLLRTPG